MSLDFTQVIVALIGLLGAVITAVVVPMIRANTSAQTQTIIANIIKTAVYAAQQMYTTEQWQEKKQFAMSQVEKSLEQYGISLDDESISEAIEAALKEIKTAVDGSWNGSAIKVENEAANKTSEVA